jgi:hypothetical protein
VKVIHFTAGATDLVLPSRGAKARFVPLARGGGETHVTCLHLLPGGTVVRPPVESDCALLIVSGSAIFTLSRPWTRMLLCGGIGVVLSAGEGYALETECGAVAITVHATGLVAATEGIAAAERLVGQGWPADRTTHPACGTCGIESSRASD